MKWPPVHEEARLDFDELVGYIEGATSKAMARRFVSEAMKSVQ